MGKTDTSDGRAALEVFVFGEMKQFVDRGVQAGFSMPHAAPFLAIAFLSQPVNVNGKPVAMGLALSRVYECSPACVEAVARKEATRLLAELEKDGKAKAHRQMMAGVAVQVLKERVKKGGPVAASAASVLLHAVAPHRWPVKNLSLLDRDAREAALWLLAAMLTGAVEASDVKAVVSMEVLTGHFGNKA